MIKGASILLRTLRIRNLKSIIFSIYGTEAASCTQLCIKRFTDNSTLISTSRHRLFSKHYYGTTASSVFVTAPKTTTEEVPFSSFPFSPKTQQAITKVFKYEKMTSVQVMAIPPALEGKDLLVKAKTGTGKTLGFLIPGIERLLIENAKILVDQPTYKSPGLSMLVLSPTRELAIQIKDEGKQLIKFHKNLSIGVIVGKTDIEKDYKLFTKRPSILVATPGRLLQHLDSTKGCSRLFSQLQILVLDEADRMLDMGFRPDIERILQHIPNNNTRQTLLFSATVTEDLKKVTNVAFGKNKCVFINTVSELEDQTHQHIGQEWVTGKSFQDQLALLHEEIYREKKAAGPEGYKIIVFFTTARMTQFAAELFCSFKEPVLEIHSRKTQRHRVRVAEEFKNKNNKIIFSSDVLARGMDFPNVNLVVQVGFTEKEPYIHRIGRTGRAGKGGRGVIILAPYEVKAMLHNLSDLPLKARNEVIAEESKECIAKACNNIMKSRDLQESFGNAYQAWLGFYKGKCRVLRWNAAELVKTANLMSSDIGLTMPPAVSRHTAGLMGLRNVPGLNLENK